MNRHNMHLGGIIYKYFSCKTPLNNVFAAAEWLFSLRLLVYFALSQTKRGRIKRRGRQDSFCISADALSTQARFTGQWSLPCPWLCHSLFWAMAPDFVHRHVGMKRIPSFFVSRSQFVSSGLLAVWAKKFCRSCSCGFVVEILVR